MTGGVVVLLGKIGRNFAAGMSGGVAYIYGPTNKKNINTELVSILDVDDKDSKVIKELLANHIKYTNSEYVSNLLYNFDPKDYFKVLPNDYAKILSYMEEAKNLGIEDSELYAFNKFTGVK
jgi:glutamate synthase (NADPH/NADH) large chain